MKRLIALSMLGIILFWWPETWQMRIQEFTLLLVLNLYLFSEEETK